MLQQEAENQMQEKSTAKSLNSSTYPSSTAIVVPKIIVDFTSQ